MVEHLVRDQGVGGSNPLSPTNLFIAYSIAYAAFLLLVLEISNAVGVPEKITCRAFPRWVA
jgi:hypothetical protein